MYSTEYESDKPDEPENEIEYGDQVQVFGIEKYEAPKVESVPEFIEELTILSVEKAENVVELRDSIEILPLEKEELVAQLIDELYIAGLIKPENQYQMVEELEIIKMMQPYKKLPKNNIFDIFYFL